MSNEKREAISPEGGNKRDAGPEKEKASATKFVVIALAVVILILLFFWIRSCKNSDAPVPVSEKPETTAEEVKVAEEAPPVEEPVVDYDKLKTDEGEDQAALMEKRKAEYGLDKSVDIIAKSDETVKIGEDTVSMREISKEISLREGEVIEKDEYFGIHVVQEGANIWDIHFGVLKEYLQNKGAEISSLSDEPDEEGFSSGIGKILKFSEQAVHSYNMKTKKLDEDLNTIQPGSEVAIFNMERLTALIDKIDYSSIQKIKFDGEKVWLPEE